MTKEIRESFLMYRSFIEAARDLPKEQRVDLYEAIFDLALENKETKLEGLSATIFKLIKPNVLANVKRYENGKKGAKHGQKGGRPKNPKKPQNNPDGVLENNPKETPNKDKDYNYNKNNNDKSEIIIPNFIDQILFDEFLQQRKKDKNPVEGLALKLTLEDLERWESKKAGSANLAIKNAIKGGWKSLIEPKIEQQTLKTEQKNDLVSKINEIAGGEIFDKFVEKEDEFDLYCAVNQTQNAMALSAEVKQKIKGLFNKKINLR